MAAPIGVTTWIDAQRYSVDSVNSLPQSPMLDLVVIRDVNGHHDVVPIGFNLRHDLKHSVFGAGYYG
ncbi:hypothetical protein QBC46DRAFT_143141, partial [Diplogelasinospora grovesii]